MPAEFAQSSAAFSLQAMRLAWASEVSGRNYRLTWGERRGDTCFGVLLAEIRAGGFNWSLDKEDVGPTGAFRDVTGVR